MLLVFVICYLLAHVYWFSARFTAPGFWSLYFQFTPLLVLLHCLCFLWVFPAGLRLPSYLCVSCWSQAVKLPVCFLLVSGCQATCVFPAGLRLPSYLCVSCWSQAAKLPVCSLLVSGCQATCVFPAGLSQLSYLCVPCWSQPAELPVCSLLVSGCRATHSTLGFCLSCIHCVHLQLNASCAECNCLWCGVGILSPLPGFPSWHL